MAIVLPKLSRRRPSTGLAAETQPAVSLMLCQDEGVYLAASSLTASWRISRVPLEEIHGLEVSVLWHTEGKGDEDLHVHHFHRVSETQIRRSGISKEHSLQCVLPSTPLSYHGRLVSIQWCVRLRLYLTDGREIVAEHPFYLVSAKMHSPCEASVEIAQESSGLEGQPVADNQVESAQVDRRATRFGWIGQSHRPLARR